MTPWLVALSGVIEDWLAGSARGIVLSPDVDGLMSAALLMNQFGGKIVGVYTTTHLVLLGDATREDASDAIWLDHDISEPGVRCIGQHLIHMTPEDTLPRRHPVSFNPNAHFGQTFSESFSGKTGTSRDKYPFGTTHMISELVGYEPEPRSAALALFAHADSSWANALLYRANCRIWQSLMFPASETMELIVDGYTAQAEALETHLRLANDLVDAGVARGSSSVTVPQGIDEAWMAVRGRQRVNGRAGSNAPKFVENIDSVLDVINGALGTSAQIDREVGAVVTGTVETPYPNRVTDLDSLMVEEAIFSHAITDFRTLRYTTDIVLNPAQVEVWASGRLDR